MILRNKNNDFVNSNVNNVSSFHDKRFAYTDVLLNSNCVNLLYEDPLLGVLNVADDAYVVYLSKECYKLEKDWGFVMATNEIDYILDAPNYSEEQRRVDKMIQALIDNGLLGNRVFVFNQEKVPKLKAVKEGHKKNPSNLINTKWEEKIKRYYLSELKHTEEENRKRGKR